MTVLMILFILMAIVMFVVGCMDQRTVYWKTRAWQYRNPEANEPSDAALSYNRFGMFVSAVLLLGCAGIVNAADGSREYSTSQVSTVASAVGSRVNKSTSSGPVSSFDVRSDVYDAVNDEGGGNVKIRAVGGHQYELTNREGENPVCLTVTIDNGLTLSGDEPWSHSISASVDDGPC